MKILALHSDYISFEPMKKAIKSAEEVEKAKKTVKECLVVFTAVETVDEKDTDTAAKMLSDEATKIAEQVQTKNIVIYPYAHLSSSLSKPDAAVKVMKKAEELLENSMFFQQCLINIIIDHFDVIFRMIIIMKIGKLSNLN